jgi:protein-tyrosine kinase
MDRLEKALEKARQQRKLAITPSSPSLAKEERTTLPSIGYITLDETQLERHRIIAHRTRCREADIFRILRTQVLQAMGKSNFKTLAITSPHYGDGKTTIALNLAMSIALDSKQTVLLVDLDLRKPSLHRYLNIDPKKGLTDFLLDQASVSDCMMRLHLERLVILPSKTILEKSSEVLGSPKMAALANELRTRYQDRLIIYDMPPLLAQDDTIAFLPHVDAALLVVRDGVTKTHEIKRCVDILANTHIIGTVLNNEV